VNAIIQAAIESEVALLSPLVAVPVAPFGYGTDLWCELDLDANLTELDPNSTLCLAQALLHRLSTRRGDLPDDLEYGRDLRELLSKGLTAGGLRAEASQYAGECTKDDRIESASLTITQVSLKELNVEIRAVARDPAIGEFSLTLAVDSAGVFLTTINGVAP
jgi:hypothetical protein